MARRVSPVCVCSAPANVVPLKRVHARTGCVSLAHHRLMLCCCCCVRCCFHSSLLLLLLLLHTHTHTHTHAGSHTHLQLWCDTESAPEAAELSQQLGYTVVREKRLMHTHCAQLQRTAHTRLAAYRDAGVGPKHARRHTHHHTHTATHTAHEQVPSITSTKLLWLKRHEPEVWSKVASVLLPHDYMNFWLTGRKVAEVRVAAGRACVRLCACGCLLGASGLHTASCVPAPV
jgi:sugar (pentulose or hexulose) kinase